MGSCDRNIRWIQLGERESKRKPEEERVEGECESKRKTERKRGILEREGR